MIRAVLLCLCVALPCCRSAIATPLLAEETCEAAFDVVVPSEHLRARGKRGATVLLHYTDPDNLLQFDLLPRSATATLRRQGTETVICRGRSGGRLLPGESVVIKRRPGRVAIACGPETIARAEAELPEGGRWGLADGDATALEDVWYQPVSPPDFADNFMRSDEDEGPWTAVAGSWRLQSLDSAEFSANAFSFSGRQDADAPALAAAGHWFWEDCTVEAAIRLEDGAEGAGVGLCYQDGPSLCLVRALRGPEEAGTLQLVRIVRGREEVLAEAPVAIRSGEWRQLGISGVEGRLTGALDGRNLLEAEDPALAHGRAALWASGGGVVHFDDVEVYAGPQRDPRPTVLGHAEGVADPAAARFARDHYMEGWADESDQWRPGGAGSVWHSGCFWGDVELSWEATPAAFTSPTALHLCVPVQDLASEPPAAGGGGYHLSLEPATEGKRTLALSKGGERRGQAVVDSPDAPCRVSLRRIGSRVEGAMGGEVVVSLEDEAPLPGGKVGMSAPAARQHARRLSISATNVIDSTFRSAPTGWRIDGGQWQMQSRWACTPRWSWFGGRSQGLASIWTRDSFEGDVVVEFFAGFAMDSPWAPFYEHPSDINITLCSDGRSPGSGYSLICAGWQNRRTAIFRHGVLVAETTSFRLPDTLDALGGSLLGGGAAVQLHKQWEHVRAERLGNTVRLLVGGKQVLTYDDPAPLPGGPAAIWTFGNGMMVARARVYYERRRAWEPPPAPVASVSPGKATRLETRQPAHIASCFEGGCDDWQAVSCRLDLAPREARTDARCLLVTNPNAGGTFALRAPVAGIDVSRMPLLAFDYAIPENVRVDVYVVVGGQKHRLRLTGPDDCPLGVEDIGEVRGRQADGRWRHAEADLLGLLRPHFAAGEAIVIDELQFANHAGADYLLAGIGGNAKGATWRLDSFFLGQAVAAPVRVEPRRRARLLVDGRASGRSVAPVRSGVVEVTAVSAGGRATDLIAYDADAPSVRLLSPSLDQEWLGRRIVARIEDEGPAGVDEASLAIEVAGQRFAWPAEELSWSVRTGELSLDLRRANLDLISQDRARVRIGPVKDRAGNVAPLAELEFAPRVAADRDPPSAPSLAGAPPPLRRCDFERGLGPLRPWGTDSGAELRRARGPAAANPHGGKWCLEARNARLGGLFGVEVACTPFEASRHPILRFDYRAPDTLRVDLIVELAGTRRTIKFTDNDATWPVIGRIDAVADDRWHRATVDLLGMLEAAFPSRSCRPVTRLAFASSGWPGNRTGVTYWLDNVEIASCLDAPPARGDVKLAASDESGIAGFAWALDDASGTLPSQSPTTRGLSAALAAELTRPLWLHAAACDEAGNWSEPAHVLLRAMGSKDSTPPTVSDLSPRPGEAACVRTVSAMVTDDAGPVSPADVRLKVGGSTYSVSDPSLTFDEATGRLTWTAPGGRPVGPDGSEIACELFATDLAGNAPAAPVSWTWRLDYSRDETPPAAPEVSLLPEDGLFEDRFEQAGSMWGHFVSCQVLRRETGGATGPGCIELRDLRERGNAFALIRDFGPEWRRFPLLRFKYRVEPPGATASLALRGTAFDGATEQWAPIASFAAGRAEWQTAVADIGAAMAAHPNLTLHRLFLEVQMPDPDAAIIIDDSVMYSSAGRHVRLAWGEPADASGIRGYSWVLDQADDTVPDETVDGAERETRFTDLAPGHWCFHMRACDSAGHWGPTTHTPFDVIATNP